MPHAGQNFNDSRSGGFTLIELMIVIAIIGILASLAVSAYQTYTVRAQVAEGLNMADGAKVPIVDAYTNSGLAPADRTAAGMSPNATDTRGNYVSAVAVTNGRIDITFGGPDAHQDIVGQTLSVTPYETNGNTVIWRCGNAAAPAGVLLQGGAGHVPPTVNPRYLPGACR
jgi:type IV pilus assembly protein PilA